MNSEMENKLYVTTKKAAKELRTIDTIDTLTFKLFVCSSIVPDSFFSLFLTLNFLLINCVVCHF